MIDQREFWNGLAGARWVREQAGLDEMLRPFGAAALDAARVTPDEAVVDVGCGCGETSLALATLVGPRGRVVGLDVSAPMLARAKERSGRFPNLSFIEGDASREPIARGAFDLLFSRFGVMFFADPTAAFINIRRSLRPNGRLAFVCWRALEENLLDILPLRAASPHLPPQPALDPDAPGPFAFADADRVFRILEGAGFEQIEIMAHDEKVGSGDIDTMLAVCTRVGALGKVLRENPELRITALPAVRSALAAHNGPDGVRLTAATWVVTARAAVAR